MSSGKSARLFRNCSHASRSRNIRQSHGMESRTGCILCHVSAIQLSFLQIHTQGIAYQPPFENYKTPNKADMPNVFLEHYIITVCSITVPHLWQKTSKWLSVITLAEPHSRHCIISTPTARASSVNSHPINNWFVLISRFWEGKISFQAQQSIYILVPRGGKMAFTERVHKKPEGSRIFSE